MSLVSRLSAFFLLALAIVLVGFSAALYLLAADHLHRQVDERLDAALATLAAAAEVNADGVEWEPDERELGLGRDVGPEQVRWVVRNDRDELVDRSRNLNERRLSIVLPPGFAAGWLRGRDGRPWSVKTRRLTAGDSTAHEIQRSHGRSFTALQLVAFAPLSPTEAMLARLGWTLTALSTSLWLLAAVAGRRLCRKALAPLARMAVAARDANAAEPDSRLPVAGTSDELEDLGHAFNGLLDRLHEALERQRRFSGDASHQLRTPLAALLSQVDVALRRERPPEEYRRVLGLVRGRAIHLRQIVESLLFLARAEAEAKCPDMEVVDLTSWVPEHLQAWSAHPRGADLHTTLDEQTPRWVRVHPPLLAQLVDNLLENAFKYSAPGTPVDVRLTREPNAILLAVADHGCGLAKDELSRVFEPFYRSPRARREGHSGIGLGLAVACRIVASFGGTIRVESELEEGSLFEIRLPEARPTVDTLAAITPHDSVA